MNFNIYDDIKSLKVYFIKSHSDIYDDIFINKLESYELEKDFEFETNKPVEITPTNNYFKKLKIPLLEYDLKIKNYSIIGSKIVQLNEIFKDYGDTVHQNCNCNYCCLERHILSSM